MNPVLTIIEGARDLISDPGKWCQGHLGLTADGRDTTGATPDTVKRCVIGAMHAVAKTHGFTQKQAEDAHQAVMKQKCRLFGWDRDLGVFNNTHTHAQVLKVLDAARKAVA